MKKRLKKINRLRGPFRCDCGSTNTGQSTYADYCNDCGWSQGY